MFSTVNHFQNTVVLNTYWTTDLQVFYRFDMEIFNISSILTIGKHILHCTVKTPTMKCIFNSRTKGNSPDMWFSFEQPRLECGLI